MLTMRRKKKVFLFPWDLRVLPKLYGTDWLEPFLARLHAHRATYRTPLILAPAQLPDALFPPHVETVFSSCAGRTSWRTLPNANWYQMLKSEQDNNRTLSQLYARSRHTGKYYTRHHILKRDGGLRTLDVPENELKHYQRAIYHQILKKVPVSRFATAYRPGSTLLNNALPHVGKRILLKLDIRNFFGHITFGMVLRAAFSSGRFPPAVGVLLANLCCLEGRLPQGAPTSPALSNIVMRSFDEHLGAWCTARGISYTRYSDDMAFSGNFAPACVIHKVAHMLQKQGMALNGKKTRAANRGQRQAVTGIVVNEKPQVRREYRRHIRQMVYYCQKYGVESHMKWHGVQPYPDIPGTNTPGYLAQLLGKINFVLSVNPHDAGMLQAREWCKKQGARESNDFPHCAAPRW